MKRLFLYKAYKHYLRSSIVLLLLFYALQVSASKRNKGFGFDLQSISFVQNSIDVSRSDKTLYFSLRAYSQLGINRIIIQFESPSGKQKLESSCLNKNNSKNSFLLGKAQFKKKSEYGEWKIHKIVIEDTKGNQKEYNENFLIKHNFTHSLFVKSKKK